MKRVIAEAMSIPGSGRLLRRLFGFGQAVSLLALLSAVGCAHTRDSGRSSVNPAQSGQVTNLEMEAVQIEVSRGANGSDELVAFDAPTLFEEGGAHMDGNRFAEAVTSFDRLLKNFPDSGYAPPALFNAALSQEILGQFADAATRYRQVTEQFPSARVAKEASLRLGACYAELGHWPASIESLEAALKRPDLNLSERVETMSRVGLGYFEIKDLTSAERVFRETLSYYQAHQEEERIESHFFVAMAQFYQAHLSHRRFRELPLRGAQKQLQQDIETLAKGFIATNDGYVAAIRYKDPFWASAAGFHIGALYRELYDTLIKAPVPVELNELQRLFYSDMLKGQLKTLLEKAQGVLQKNVEWASRVGVKNGWIEKSSEQLEELSRLLAAIDTQPVGPSVPTPTPKTDAPLTPPRPLRHSPGDTRPRSLL